MLAVAHVVHRLAGRTRLKVPARRGDAEYFAQLAERLATCEGVQHVRANTLTASVLIEHAGDIAAIGAFAQANVLFALHPADEPAAPLAQLLAQQARTLDAGLRGASGGSLDLMSLGLLLLAGLALFQLQQGHVLAPTATLVWYALSLVMLAARESSDH